MRFGLAKVAAGIAGAAMLALAASAAPAAAQTVNPLELAVEGPLGDLVLGNAKAPVTVIEYASMTCPHCATFHNNTYDAFKANYIDTGLVRFIVREFPLDAWAAAAFALARCSARTGGAEAYYDLIEAMFAQQQVWTADIDAFAAFAAEHGGFTTEEFLTCIDDDDAFNHMQVVYDRGIALGVSATPTFFINGQKYTGVISYQDLSRMVDELR